SGVEIVLGETPAVPVSGTVIDGNGRPLQGYTFINARRISNASRDFGGPGTQVRDGTFKMHLTAGEYELETRGTRPGVMGPPRPGDELFGLPMMSVASAPASDRDIQLGPGSVVPGRMRFG